MKKIEFAMESKLFELSVKLLSGESLGLTIMLFHHDGYRILHTKGPTGLSICRAYLQREPADAYGILFEGEYGGGFNGAMSCLLMAIVTKEGNAKVQHIPLKADEHGKPVLEDRRPVFLDEDFLRLYEPLDPTKHRVQEANKMADEVIKSTKHPYRNFFVAIENGGKS